MRKFLIFLCNLRPQDYLDMIIPQGSLWENSLAWWDDWADDGYISLCDNGIGNEFTGWIDDLKIYNYALSYEEMENIWKTGIIEK